MTNTPQPTVNGHKAFRLFLKGDDVTASLSVSAGNNSAETTLLDQWTAAKQANGITISLNQEPCYPTALLIQQLDGVELPEELGEQGLDEAYINAQFQSSLFERPSDVIILSILPEITADLWQRRENGYLISPPPDWEQRWSPVQQNWFQANFDRLDHSSVAEFKENVGRLIELLQEEGESQLVLYGCSSYDPADTSHNYHESGETATLRVHRLNYALVQLSLDTGIVILDVDRIVAELGGRTHVSQRFNYSPEANRAIGKETLRIIEELGFFDEHPLLKLMMPQLDQQFKSGSIVKWHAREGKWVKGGDDLFDFRVEEIKRFKRINTDNPDEMQAVEVNSRKWSWLVRVTATDTGFFRKKYISEETACSVGDLLAIFTVRDNERVKQDDDSIATAPAFRVVANILETADQDTLAEQQPTK
ncbi:MAG: lipoyl domain-containing protein [Candidatus Promineifilaceae bacterium]